MIIRDMIFNPTHFLNCKTFITTLFIRGIPIQFTINSWIELINMRHTRFEKARIIGARALQINLGAPPLIKESKNMLNVIEMAEMEYLKGIIPINSLRNI